MQAFRVTTAINMLQAYTVEAESEEQARDKLLAAFGYRGSPEFWEYGDLEKDRIITSMQHLGTNEDEEVIAIEVV